MCFFAMHNAFVMTTLLRHYQVLKKHKIAPGAATIGSMFGVQCSAAK